MLITTYQNLRKELAGEKAFHVSNVYGVLTILGECLLFGGSAFWLGRTTPFGMAYWMAVVVTALSAYRLFVIVHECGHGSLFRRPWLNHLFGLLASPVCLVPYFPWRSIHAQHHQWVGVIDKDPTQAHLLELKNLSRLQRLLFRFFWLTWIPAPFIKFVYDVFWGYPFREFRKGNRGEGLRGLLSLCACLWPHVALVCSLGFVRYAIVVGPMYLAFYAFFELMNLPQHSGHFPYVSADHPRPIPFRQQDAITRTTYLPRWLAVLLCYNFNLHVEHHLFPTVPWYRLPQVTDKVRQMPQCQYESVGFFTFMVDLRLQDPLDIYEKALPATNPEVQRV